MAQATRYLQFTGSETTTIRGSFGVCFSGAYFNIARQSVAESIPLAMDVADAAINSLESPKRSAWVVVDNRHAPDLLINSIVYSGRESAEAEAKRQRIGRGCDDRPESIAAKEMMYV